MTLEEAVKGDLSKSLEEWAKYFYSLGYEAAKSEIVHCKECKHRVLDPQGMIWECLYSDFIKPDHYCGYAERKEE